MNKKYTSIFKEKIYEVSALICDYVRAEINNKRTFVGVYPNVFISNRKKITIKELE